MRDFKKLGPLKLSAIVVGLATAIVAFSDAVVQHNFWRLLWSLGLLFFVSVRGIGLIVKKQLLIDNLTIV